MDEAGQEAMCYGPSATDSFHLLQLSHGARGKGGVDGEHGTGREVGLLLVCAVCLVKDV